MITLEYIKQIISYDPETGVMVWTGHKPWTKRNKQVGNINKDGYWSVMVDGVNYPVHRLAWFYMTGTWPAKDIDHADLNRTNNKWVNLREATRGQNMQNGSLRADSSTGYKGVTKHRPTGKFRAYIKKSGKQKHLGLFLTAEEASEAYKAAAKAEYGEFYREE